MSKLRKVLTVLSACLIIGSISYFYKSNNQGHEEKEIATSADENSGHANKQEQSLLVSYDLMLASDLSEMLEQSDLVVLGKYTSFDSSWNNARNPNNLYEESTENYIEGKLYNFKIDEVLVGDLQTKEIRVNHRYSEIINYEETSGDEIISEEGLLIKEPSEVTVHQIENIDPTFIEPEYNKQYIIFLKESFDTNNNIYLRAIEPYLISIETNKAATLESNLIDYNKTDFTNEITLNKTTLSILNEVNGEVTDFINGKTLKDLKKEINYLKE